MTEPILQVEGLRVAFGDAEPVVRDVSFDLTPGRVRHFGPHYVHQVRNIGVEPAVSVHVYTPGLSWMNTYAIDGGSLRRTGTERAGVDW